ncbi:MAG: 1-acyl-sn-glycerol-3-phosphate acyltransferase [Clostridia bacterium]|nr:1-acyl-sn-glycerol-3-phosphate acyltransferase [Clostridia bacterium]
MARKDNAKKWVKPIHKFGKALVAFFVYPFIKLKYRATVEKFKEQNGRQYLVLYNHQTPFDQFFVGLAIKGVTYYVSSEDVLSKGFISRIINLVVAPIPIKKNSSDVRSVMNMIKVKNEGGTIAIAPEGNRTYNGRTCYIAPSIAPLIKKLNLPVAIFKIEGGYGVQPRWSNVVRRGKINCKVTTVLEPESYKNLSNNELYSKVVNLLSQDENVSGGEFVSKKSAEYLERLVYVCPYCGLSSFESKNDKLTCKKCGKTAIYHSNKTFSGDFNFKNVGEWSDYQEEFIKKLDLSRYNNVPAYKDVVSVYNTFIYKSKKLLYKNATVTLYGNRVEINETAYAFSDILAFTVLGRNKINFYLGEKVYQIKGNKRFNGVKYLNFFYHYKNILKENDNEQFLGL